jgi:DNA polymerase III subunit epsilon
MDKILYFDVETTGLKPDIHDIIELAFIIEIDGEVKEKQLINMQPYDWAAIDPEALQVSGHSEEKLKTYMPPKKAYQQFVGVLGKYCDKYNREDKFYPAGFNCGFDLEFLNGFFYKNGDKYFGSWQNWRMLDPRPILLFLNFMGKIALPKYSLEEACKYFDIKIDAHSAESDIEATRALLYKLKDIFSPLVLTTEKGGE